MLGVDRKQLAAALPESLLQDRTARHQTLFVGESQPVACLQGGDRGAEADRANDPVHYDHTGPPGQIYQAVGAKADSCSQSRGQVLPFGVGGRGNGDVGFWMLESDRQKLVGAAPGGHTGYRDLEPVGYLEGLTPDGAGGPENDERFYSSPVHRSTR